MRVTYRNHGGNKLYWQKRWDNVGADTGKLDLKRYPGRFSEMALSWESLPTGPVLEAGCGTGRVVMHYDACKEVIVGMDFIETALNSIKKKCINIPLLAADITRLPFASETFRTVLAFGLYHNMEKTLKDAVYETRRVMKKNAVLCTSMRIDNIQNMINDFMGNPTISKKQRGRDFHKINMTTSELKNLFESNGFKVERIEYVENMPLMYKVRIFRHKSHRVFDERRARGEGYRLSFLGEFFQSILRIFPMHFSNLAVVFARAV